MKRRPIRGDKRSLRDFFGKNRRLRKLSPKTKLAARATLGKLKAGGISHSDVDTAYSRWRRNKKDRISTAEARIIKEEFTKQDKQSKADLRKRPTSNLSMHPLPEQDRHDDPRANLDTRPGAVTHPDDPRDPTNWQDPPPPGMDS